MAVPEEFCFSFAQMVQYSNEALCNPGEYVHLDRSIASFHSSARNNLVQRCLGEWILMLDTDHYNDPDLLARMVGLMKAENIEVLSGLYRYRVPPYLPTVYKWVPSLNSYTVLAEMDWSAPLVEIDCAGAGCLLVKRSVFARITHELKEEPFSIEGRFSEDFSFFNRLRRLGIKSYVSPQIESSHLKVHRVTGADTDLSGLSLGPPPS